MIKLLLIGLVIVGLSEASLSGMQLVLPDYSYSILTNAKSSSNSLDNSIPAFSNAISEEDKSSKALSEESSNDYAAISASSQSPSAASTAAPATATSSAPAALSRVKPPSAFSSITTTSGIARGSLLISSSAQATATANSGASSAPLASARSTATIQHRIFPAETIPLPITISTRPGLRTIIAPETITVQQPGIAKVGEVVQQIPTAVSHQRQTVVHNHARIVTPIVAPAVRTSSSQIVRAYHTPLVYAPHVVEDQD